MIKGIIITTIVFFSLVQISVSQDTKLNIKVKKGKYGFINQKGKKVIDLDYTYAEPFSEGLAVVEQDLKFGYITTTGEIKIPIDYYDAGCFSEGLAYVAKNKKYGFIDTDGKIIIDFQYDLAENFVNGLAVVRIKNPDTIIYGRVPYLEGLINHNNELFTNQWYGTISRIEKSSFKVTLKGEKYKLSDQGDLEKIDEVENVTDFINKPRPEYIGGNNELFEYLKSNVRYPVSARQNYIQGKVMVGFFVNEIGEIKDPSVLFPIHPLLDKEAIRVVKEMPKWKPAQDNGKPITTRFVLPILFKLN